MNIDKEISKLIQETISQLKNKSIGKNGLIRKIYFINEKKWYEFYKPDDYGDHVPFISVGESSTVFAKKQLDLWKNRMLDGVPVPKHTKPLPVFPALIYLDDFLDGLAVMYHTFRDQQFLEEGVSICNKINKLFSFFNGSYSSVVLPYLHIPIPEGLLPVKPSLKKIWFVNSAANGLVCEKMLDFGVWSKNKKLIERARKCIDYQINLQTFKKYGIFPDMSFPADSPICHVAKFNTNPAYSLLKSSQIKGGEQHKKALIRNIDSVFDIFYSDGGIIDHYNPKKSRKGEVSFVSTNAFCRLLIEASLLLQKEKYWKIAEDIVFNIAEQAFLSKKNNFWKEQMYEDDGEGDFANLVMILDKKRNHINLLEIIFKDMVNKFYIGDGIWKDYYPKKMQQTAHSKYLGGVLKYLVIYKAYRNNEDMLSKKWLYISQDR